MNWSLYKPCEMTTDWSGHILRDGDFLEVHIVTSFDQTEGLSLVVDCTGVIRSVSGWYGALGCVRIS